MLTELTLVAAAQFTTASEDGSEFDEGNAAQPEASRDSIPS